MTTAEYLSNLVIFTISLMGIEFMPKIIIIRIIKCYIATNVFLTVSF